MAIFASLLHEDIVQVDDKTRLDASNSFVTQDEAAITLLRIRPSAADAFIDVTTDSYLDWAYAADGTVTVTVEITTDGAPITKDFTLNVVTEVDDKLFSTDSELFPYENDVLRYTPSGKNSFKFMHRAAQDRILKYLDEKRIWDTNDDRLTKDAIVDIEEVKDWSKFLTLQMIFETNSNQVDDIFSQKARKYGSMMEEARNRAALRLDRDGDGNLDDNIKDLRAFTLRRG